jgi:asparagine synthase (glutamine-hydrolysing)
MAAHAGIWYYDGRPVPSNVLNVLSRGNAALGSDSSGIYVDCGIALVSFSTHFDQLSTNEKQPITLPSGTAVTWDGRLDNRDDFLVRLREDIQSDRSDARLMALAVHRWREEALRTALGDWSMVLWDASIRELLLACDFVGNRPLHFCVRPEYVVWSTALDPIVELCDLAGQINDTYMARFLTFSPPEHLTVYRDVVMVPPGHSVRLRARQPPVSRPFLMLSPGTLRYHDPRQYEEHYRDLFFTAVRVRLRAHKPVWAELSGGYDSSSITCVAASLVKAHAVETARLQPVSIVVPDSPESDESRYIESVEALCGLKSVRLRWGGEFKLDPDAGAAIGAFRDGADTISAAFDAGSHVLLSGAFGDDVTSGATAEDALREYVRNRQWRHLIIDSMNACRMTRSTLFDLFRSLLHRSHSDTSNNASGWLRRYAHSAIPPTRALAFGLAAKYALRCDFVERAFESQQVSSSAVTNNRVKEQHTILQALAHHVAHGGFNGLLAPCALRMTYPFTHRPLLEFVLAVPSSILWRPEHPREFICRALRDVLPDAVVRRRNKGYASPALNRYITPVVAAAIANLSDWQLVNRGYSDPTILTAVFTGFLDGSRSTSTIVRRLLEAERLLRAEQRRECTAHAQTPVETLRSPMRTAPMTLSAQSSSP